jgi:hypothetical protein
LVQVGLFNCKPVLRGSGNLPRDTLSTAALLRADSGQQLDLEIASQLFSSKDVRHWENILWADTANGIDAAIIRVSIFMLFL